MKKFFLRLTLGLLSLALFSCSDSLTEKNDLAFLAFAARSEGGQYGSIVVNDSRSDSRALEVSLFSSVTVTVSGYGMDDIVKENVEASGGKGAIRIDGIPVGANRVVTVKADSDGALIRALVDIERDVVKTCIVNWDSTAVAGIFYNLIKADVDVSSINNTYFDSYIPEVHASLVDVESIAADYQGKTLSSADSYILDFIDATSKKKKSKNKNKNNNIISSEVKPNKILDINENIDNNNKEIKENNEDIINVNNNQNEDNNIININIMDKGKNLYNQTKEIEININSKKNQNYDNNIINNEKNQDINNKFKIKKQNTTSMKIANNLLDKNKSKELDKERIKIYN